MTDTAFSSELLIAGDLPDADAITYHRLERKHGTSLLVGTLLVWFVVTVVWSVIVTVSGIESSLFPRFVFYLFPILPLVLIFIACRVIAASYGYAVRDQDVHYRKGVIWRSETSLPFSRIQHVEVDRGPLERLYGLSTLKFFAAGGGSADLSVPGLNEADAIKLRAFILDRIGADHNDD